MTLVFANVRLINILASGSLPREGVNETGIGPRGNFLINKSP